MLTSCRHRQFKVYVSISAVGCLPVNNASTVAAKAYKSLWGATKPVCICSGGAYPAFPKTVGSAKDTASPVGLYCDSTSATTCFTPPKSIRTGNWSTVRNIKLSGEISRWITPRE